MSGWIKIEKDLESDPRVLRMARALDDKLLLFKGDEVELDPCNACALPSVTLVCGALTRLWILADSHIRADNTLDMGADELDEWLGVSGFCNIMPDDWLKVVDGHTVELPSFQEHNGVEARKRALTQKRVTHHRDTTKRTSVTGSNADALPDQTKTRPRIDHKRGAPPGVNLEAWERWLAYRHDIRKPIKPASMQAAQRKLAGFGSEQAAVVEQSIANGWQGLFALKDPKPNGHGKRTRYEEAIGREDQVEIVDGPSSTFEETHGQA